MASAISQTPNGSHSGSLARRARGTAFRSGSPGLRREFSSGRNLTGNSLGWNFQGNLSDEFFGRIMLRLGTGWGSRWSSRWRFLLRISSGKSPVEILKILHAKFLSTWQYTEYSEKSRIEILKFKSRVPELPQRSEFKAGNNRKVLRQNV